MTIIFTLQGSDVWASDSKDSAPTNATLPNKTYTIKQHPITGAYYLTEIEDFLLPSKLYGNTVQRADRIINTFKIRGKSTGVLLHGLKGCGKSLLLKTIAAKSRMEHGLPTIVINSTLYGEGFNQFIQDISSTQPILVVLDEFEKVYNKDDGQQAKLLTLFDGVYNNNCLFILTANDKYRLDQFMLNRPGRIHYCLQYKSLDEAIIKEYCEDNLIDKSKTKQIIGISKLIYEFSFDMLHALVFEMNQYPDDTVEQTLEFLNIEINGSSRTENYDLEIYHKGKVVYKTNNNLHPLTNTIHAVYWDNDDVKDNDLSDDEQKLKSYFKDNGLGDINDFYITITPQNLIAYNSETGETEWKYVEPDYKDMGEFIIKGKVKPVEYTRAAYYNYL